MRDGDKPSAVEIARDLVEARLQPDRDARHRAVIGGAGVEVTPVNKVAEGRPHIVDMIKNGEISFIVNTVEEKRTAIADSRSIRTTALRAAA